ncbi:MAG: DUF2752 domain-containing protein [Planctomycetota bacterium]
MTRRDDQLRSGLHAVVLATPFVGLLVLLALRLATEPDARGYGTHEQLGFAPCGFREWLGGPCPTCGVTTSASHFVRGEIAASWAVQPFGTAASFAVIAFAVAFVVMHRRGVDLGLVALRYGGAFWATVAVALTAAWLL